MTLSLAELFRRLENLVRLGTVMAVDTQALRVRVKSGDMETGWPPWTTWRTGSGRSWWPPGEEEQVVLLSPSGDPSQAVVLASE